MMLEEIAKLCENMQKANDLLDELATKSEERREIENGAAVSDNKLENEQNNIKDNASGLGQSKPPNKDSSVTTTELFHTSSARFNAISRIRILFRPLPNPNAQ
jgi:hypothetical protein